MRDYLAKLKTLLSRNKSVDAELNPNKDNKKTIILVLVVLALTGLGYLAYSFMFTDSVPVVAKKKPNYVRVKDRTFTEADNTSALSHQQSTIEALEKQVADQAKHIKDLTESHKKQQDDFNKQNTELQQQITTAFQKSAQAPTETTGCATGQCAFDITKLPKADTSADRPYPATEADNRGAFGREEVAPYQQVSSTELETFQNPFVAESEKEAEKPYQRTWKNYVPTGTFCRAVILGGADANAGVDAQGDTAPIIFKVMNNCVLPNGKYSQLKGAFITASTYGQMSSERGMVRLDNLSLTKKDGTILDIPVEGTAFDVGGKNGVRGIPNLRNAKVIQASGAAGFLSGIGGALTQSAKTTSVSALGSTESLNAGGVFKAGLGQGTQSALAKIADYYLKLAEQYSPIIPLNPGAMVDIVFLKGFPIENEEMMKRYENTVNQARADQNAAQNGQTITLPNIPTPGNLGAKVNVPSYNEAFNQALGEKK